MNSINQHDLLVLSYREMDKLVSKKLRKNPSLINKVRQNLNRWMKIQREQSGYVSSCKLEWDEILRTQPLEKILEILEGETQETDRLQHSSPFSGILTQEERESCLKAHYAAISG